MKENDVAIMRYIHYQCYSELLHTWMEAVKGTEEYSTFRKLTQDRILAVFVVCIRVPQSALGPKLL